MQRETGATSEEFSLWRLRRTEGVLKQVYDVHQICILIVSDFLQVYASDNGRRKTQYTSRNRRWHFGRRDGPRKDNYYAFNYH
jgi:hypothetical protein